MARLSKTDLQCKYYMILIMFTADANLVTSLRTKYRTFNNELGQTGAGLRKEEVTPGSDISNKIGKHPSLHSCVY